MRRIVVKANWRMYGDDMTTAVVEEKNYEGKIVYYLYDIFQDIYNKTDIFELRSFCPYRTFAEAVKALYNITKNKNINADVTDSITYNSDNI